ncbi:MAG: SxtJ family membrane protein [Syntrophobacteraceae bacterium]
MKFSFFKGASKEQSKDFGMVVTLALLITAWFTEQRWALQAAILILLVNVIYPSIYRTLASAWFNFSIILGSFVSKLVLSIAFAALVIPVGVVRRMLGYDSLNLKKWKKDGSSVFTVRDHTFAPEDLDRPY